MRGRYRIVDAACLDVLRALRDALREEGLPFALAGGMAVQALLAAAGLEHLLRTTGDVGIVVNGQGIRPKGTPSGMSRSASPAHRYQLIQTAAACLEYRPVRE